MTAAQHSSLSDNEVINDPSSKMCQLMSRMQSAEKQSSERPRGIASFNEEPRKRQPKI